MKYFQNLIVLTLLVVISSFPTITFAQTDDAINKGLNYLKSQQQTNGQILGFNGVSAWAAMAFSGAGIDISTISQGGNSLLDYLKSNSPAADASATEWEREILAITASGQNPFNFGGKNYVQALEALANNSQIGDPNLINDDMFGLLALISAGSETSNQIKQDALNFILANQSSSGGFGYSKTSGPDIDTTAAAIQALKASQNAGIEHNNLSSAINSARAYLLSGQNADGGFGYLPGEVSNASTTAWVEMALSALEETSEPIQKANTYLINSQEENGSFKWQSSFPGDTFTSSYAVLALEGEYWPVKIFEEVVLSPSPMVSPSVIPSPSALPSPTVSPSTKPKPEIEFGFDLDEMFRHQEELMSRMREKQGSRFERMQQKFQERMNKLEETLRIFR